jgi:uncharacterized membrane protein
MSEEIEEISSESGEELQRPSDRSRWIAALSYLTFLCFFSLWKGKDDEYIHYHARQGFLLLLVEVIAVILLVILEWTLGRLQFIGLIIIILLQLAVGIGAVILSVLGFVKALFGEYWHLPFLGEYRDRVPHLHDHK